MQSIMVHVGWLPANPPVAYDMTTSPSFELVVLEILTNALYCPIDYNNQADMLAWCSYYISVVDVQLPSLAFPNYIMILHPLSRNNSYMFVVVHVYTVL